jgi:hypothetical protein
VRTPKRCRTEGADIGPCAGATPSPNDRPAPDVVVGMRVLAACEGLVLSGYRGGGVVIGEVSDGGVGPGRVVSHEPPRQG